MVRGRPVQRFERIVGKRAEALDCVCYAYAARQGLSFLNLDARNPHFDSSQQARRRRALRAQDGWRAYDNAGRRKAGPYGACWRVWFESHSAFFEPTVGFISTFEIWVEKLADILLQSRQKCGYLKI